MNFEEIQEHIRTKLGEENHALIADDMASLITLKASRDKDIQSKDEEIKRLKSDKEMLIQANGNLLQQVGMAKEEVVEDKNEEKEEKRFSFKSLFDDKGNWK